MEWSNRKERVARIAMTAWAAIGWLLLVAALLWLLGLVMPALVPFMMGGIIVLILRTPVNLLEARGIPRTVAVSLCYVLMFAVLTIVSAFVMPAIGDQLQQFSVDLPGYFDAVAEWWSGLQGQARAIVLPAWIITALTDAAATISSTLAGTAKSAASGILSVGQSAATLLFDMVLALVIGFWALKDLPKVRTEVMALVGEHRRGEAEMILETVLRVLGGYIRGQLIVSAVTGVIVWLGLSLLGVPYALVLGLLTGMLNVLPYIGPFIGGLFAAIVGLFISPLFALGALGVVIGAQQLTDMFVTPRVMSEQVDLHPLLVIFSLLVGGTLFGFWGLFLAIPVAAIIKGLFVYYYEKHTDRVISTEDGVLFRSRPAEDEPDPDGDSDSNPSTTDPKTEETQA